MLVSSQPTSALLKSILTEPLKPNSPEYKAFVEKMTKQNSTKHFVDCLRVLLELGDYKETLNLLRLRVASQAVSQDNKLRFEVVTLTTLSVEILEELAACPVNTDKRSKALCNTQTATNQVPKYSPPKPSMPTSPGYGRQLQLSTRDS